MASLSKRANETHDELAAYRQQAESVQNANRELISQNEALRNEASHGDSLRAKCQQLEREKSSLLRSHSSKLGFKVQDRDARLLKKLVSQIAVSRLIIFGSNWTSR